MRLFLCIGINGRLQNWAIWDSWLALLNSFAAAVFQYLLFCRNSICVKEHLSFSDEGYEDCSRPRSERSGSFVLLLPNVALVHFEANFYNRGILQEESRNRSFMSVAGHRCYSVCVLYNSDNNDDPTYPAEYLQPHQYKRSHEKD